MGEPLKAEMKASHFATIVSPSLAATPFGDRQVFGTPAVNFAFALMPAFNTYGNSAPLFLKRSRALMPTGVSFKPSECLQDNPVESSYATSHGHMGTIRFPNGGTVPGAINCGVLPGPNADCSAELEGLLEAIAERMAAEFMQDPLKFLSQFKAASDETMLGALGDTAKGWWGTIKGAAVAAGGAIKDGTVASYEYVTTHSASEMASDAVDGAKAAYDGAVELTSDAIEFIDKGIDALKQLSFEDLKQIFKEWLREVFGELVCSLRDALAQMAADPRPMATQLGEVDGMAKAFVAETAGAILVDTFVTKGAMSAASKIGRVAGKVGPKIGGLVEKIKRRIAMRRGGHVPEHPSRKPDLPEPKKTPHAAEPEKKPVNDALQGTANAEGNPKCLLCPTEGAPVNTIYGCKILSGDDDLDFRIAGPLPLDWQRTYVSSNDHEGWLGQGWSVPLSFRLDIEENAVVFVDTQGRRTPFPPLPVGGEYFSAYEHTRLRRTERNQYELVSADGIRIVFGLSPRDFAELEQNESLDAEHAEQFRRAVALIDEPEELMHAAVSPPLPQARTLVMLGLIDGNGNWQRVHYTQDDLPQVVELSAGRRIGLVFAAAGARNAVRLSKVLELLGEPDAEGRFPRSETLVEYRYDESGDLLAVLDVDGHVVRRFAWSNHIMVEHAQPGGLVSRYEWDRCDARGRVIRNWLSTGEDLRFSYDETIGETTVVDAGGRVTRYRFDSNHYLTERIDPAGGSTRYERDVYGNLIAEISPGGRTTRYTYDARGNLIAVELADGGRYRMTYDESRHRLLTITDPLDRTTTYRHDERGNLVETELAHGAVTRYRVGAGGMAVAVTDARGGVSSLHYDECARLVSQTDCLGQETRYSYDERGDLVSIADAAGQTTRLHYVRVNRRSRIAAVIHPDGATERYSYDTLGRLTAHVDALGNATHYVLAEDGKPLRRVNAAGHSFSYLYDAHRRLVALTNENGATHRLAWDVLDRIVAEQGFDGRRQDHRHDADGHLLESADGVAAGSPWMGQNVAGVLRTRYERDALGRLLRETSVKARGPLPPAVRVNRFRYDAAGQLTTAVNDSARVELSYDAAGQIVRESIAARSGLQATLLHEYDAMGNRTATTLPDGRRVASRIYGSSHVDRVEIDGDVVCEFERDRLYRETVRTQGALRTYFERDAAGRLVASQVRRRSEVKPPAGPAAAPGDTTIARHYRYDAVGQLLEMVDARRGTSSYRYDPLNQLAAAQSRSANDLFAFDPAGNIVDPAQEPEASAGDAHRWNDEEWSEFVRRNIHDPDFNPLQTPAEQGLDPQGWAAAEPNRLLSYRGHRYRYDTWGNCVEKSSPGQVLRRLYWNAEHQLERVQRIGLAGAETWGYDYDAFGRRIAKYRLDAVRRRLRLADPRGRRAAADIRAAARSPGATLFLWDGNRLLTEYDAGKQQTYLYEPDSFVPLAIVRNDRSDASVEPAPVLPRELSDLKDLHPAEWAEIERRARRLAAKLAVDDGAAESPLAEAEVFYLHTDHLGVPLEATDAAGKLVWSASYRPLGRGLVQHGNVLVEDQIEPDAFRQNLRFPGQYYDEESGLHYNRYRYYDPDCGRFLSQDPVGLWGGDNAYVYAPNPINYTDEFGLKFGSSTALGRAITGRSSFPGRQPHHMIPVQAFNRNSKGGAMLQNLQNCGLFSLDGKGNGIMLPEQPNPGTTRAKHRGFHSVYNQALIEMIEDIAATTPCAKDQAKKIQSLQSRIHESLRTGKMSLYKPTTKVDWLNFLRK